MKIIKPWLTFLLGCILGCIAGGVVIAKAYSLFWNQYDVGDPMLRIMTAMQTIKGVEDGDDEQILSHHQMLLRGSFVSLTELHKTGNYPKKESEIEKILQNAKNFMTERPEMFIDQSFTSGGLPFDEENTTNTTSFMRDLLQDSFDYVGELPELESN
ncbi:hypothetical protein P3T73_06945 [Kiritimatiellota bacterium B12222]|nr:hypothetical protein P3T73_06945 [Kiritimatiellota bacterium B12222]